MTIKKAFEKHKKAALIIGGGIIVTTIAVGGYILLKKASLDPSDISKAVGEIAKKVPARTINDLPKPDFGTGVNITDFWTEGGATNMIAEIDGAKFETFAEKVFNEMLKSDPNRTVSIIMGV